MGGGQPLRIALGIAALILLLAGGASAAIITVDDSGGADYTKITDAITAANAGDTIEVRSGTYYENINVIKRLILKGVDTGNGKPIIDANWNGVITTISSDSSTIDGFVLRNGRIGIELNGNGIKVANNEIQDLTGKSYYSTPPFDYYGIGILIASSNNEVSNNIISKISGSYGSGFDVGSYSFGIYAKNNNNKISKNEIFDIIGGSNYWHGGSPGFGIYLSLSSGNTISSNNIFNINSGSSGRNGQGGVGTGIYLDRSTNNNINDNIVSKVSGQDGLSPGKGIGIHLYSSSINVIYYNDLFDNRAFNAFDESGINQWDNGIIGNHYSNFDEPTEGCFDSNNNGICDSNYNIPGGSNTDRYPLVRWTPPVDIELDKNFRYTDVDFVPIDPGPDGILGTQDDVQLPAELGEPLPDANANGKFDVKYVLQPKDGIVASTNPGQLYGVITIFGTGVDTVNLADTFGSQFDVNPAKLGGGVEVIRVDSGGFATVLTDTAQVTSASVDNIAGTVNVGIDLDTPLGVNDKLMIYIKFQTALKGQIPDFAYFVNNANIVINNNPGTTADATIEFV